MKIHEMLTIVVVLIIMPSLISVPVYGDNNADIKNRVAKLYFSTVKKVLKEDFWNPRDVADLSEVLLVPMDFAFKTKNVEIVRDFEQSFQRFIKESGEKELDKQSDLVKMQFYHILSEFLVLAGSDFSNYKFDIELKRQLFSIIKMKFQKFWVSPTKVWDVCIVNDFNSGQFEMISWQLETVFPKKSYCTAIMDDSKFAIGIAANLYSALGQIKIPITPEEQEGILDAIRLGDRIFSEQISFIGNKGAWLFQPGVWWDHPDYWWSGYDI